jgi:thiol-disulfide isomerase/thioredoxin
MDTGMNLGMNFPTNKRTTRRKSLSINRDKSQRKSKSKSKAKSQSKSDGIELLSGDSGEIKLLESLISKGPVTIVLVFSPSCPHCVSYKPIWEQLCNVPGRKANMVSVESSVYQKTPLSQKKPVRSVPTVLYVDSEGKVSEAGEPRNTEVMTNAVKLLPGSDLPASLIGSQSPPGQEQQEQPVPQSPPIQEDNEFERSGDPLTELDNDLDFKPMEGSVVPGTSISDNPLHPMPATVVTGSNKKPATSQSGGFQQGGNPWAAFMMAAAQQAAPAAALFGAYSLMPARSSGLEAPERKTRKKRTSRKAKGSKARL